jgi:hypothetical protein
MVKKTTRRDFLKRTALAAGTVAGVQQLTAPYVLADPAANSKLGIAVVACGGMGGGNPSVAANERRR